MVTSQDQERARQTIDESWRQQATPEELAAADHVVDHDAETITCPACTTEFASGPEHCPDCGLRIG